MNRPLKNTIKAITFIGSFMLTLKGQLLFEQKKIRTTGYSQEAVEIIIPKNVPFDQKTLEKLVAGEDIIPAFPEQGAMCAKTMRALTNTLLGDPYFTQNRFLSKIEYKLAGQETLPADTAGINGDAWEMFYHIQESEGQLLYFSTNPISESKEGIAYITEHARIGDIIGFYYPDSKYNNLARNAGPGFTHMSLVVGQIHNEETQQTIPLIAHLFHSDQYFPAKEETSIEYTRKEILSTIYNVEHNTLPAFRIEPITNLEKELIFEGYQQVPKEDSQRTEPEYKQGDQLLYVKALLRPKYTQ